MSDNTNNPLNFLQGMWNQMGFQLPGMVTPTLDEGELDKQIKDLKSVENWLRMNLSMLQMTIQNLEMQKSALGTFRTMSSHFTHPEKPTETPENPFSAFFQAAQQPGQTASPAPVAPASPTADPSGAAPDEAALAKAAMWPWEMMNDINTKMQEQLAEATKSATAKAVGKAAAGTKAGAGKKAAAKKPAAKAAAKSRAKKSA